MESFPPLAPNSRRYEVIVCSCQHFLTHLSHPRHPPGFRHVVDIKQTERSKYITKNMNRIPALACYTFTYLTLHSTPILTLYRLQISFQVQQVSKEYDPTRPDKQVQLTQVQSRSWQNSNSNSNPVQKTKDNIKALAHRSTQKCCMVFLF